MRNKLMTILLNLAIMIFVISGCVNETKPGLEEAESIGLLMTGISSKDNQPFGLTITALLKNKEGEPVFFKEEVKVHIEIIETSKEQKPIKVVYKQEITVEGSNGLKNIEIPFTELDSTVNDPSTLPHVTNIAISLPGDKIIGKSEERVHQPYPKE